MTVASLYKSDDHPVAYDGPKVAEQQKKAYPDLAPLVLKAPCDKVFAAAQAALASMGLEPVEAAQAASKPPRLRSCSASRTTWSCA